MALVTTFGTTPLTIALYPPSYQKKLDAWKKGLIDWDTGKPIGEVDDSTSVMAAKFESAKVRDLLVYLRLDNMPALLTFVSLLGGKPADIKKVHPAKAKEDTKSYDMVRSSSPQRPIEVHGVRMMELTDRDSSVMQVSEVDEYSYRDPIINTFRNVGRLYNLVVSGEVVVAPEASFAELLTTQASRDGSDLLLLPWSESGSMSERQPYFDGTQMKRDSTSYTMFVSDALSTAPCNIAVLVNRGLGGTEQKPSLALRRTPSALSMRSHREKAVAPAPDRSHHMFMPYFGGADGRVALRLVLQLAENPDITATIIHFSKPATASELTVDISESHEEAVETSRHSSKTGRIVHGTAEAHDEDSTFFEAIKRSLPTELVARVVLESVQSSSPIDDAAVRAETEVAQNPKNAGDMIVVGKRTALISESSSNSGSLGAVADVFLKRNLKASMLVVQARNRGSE